MAILVDSNIILDVATEDRRWGEWSSQALARAADQGILVINPIVFAEVSVGFHRIEDLEKALPPEVFSREPLPYEAAFLWEDLRIDVGAGTGTFRCRTSSSARTQPSPVTSRLNATLPRYRTYFPRLSVIAP